MNTYPVTFTSPLFTLIAGPCVIEGEEITRSIADTLCGLSAKYDIPLIFKASYRKANRSRYDSFTGIGDEKGLEILARIREDFKVPVVTDVHLPEEAARAASYGIDMLQIPAFLCRQTDLLVAAAKTGKCINIKKAQFLAPWDMYNCVEKVRQSGNDNVMLCERGTTFGYNTLVVDMTGLRVMKDMNVPVIFDATHSVQKPGGNGTSTGGNRQYVEYLAKAAIAVGADGLFMETHPDPDHAKSDGPNMVPLGEMKELLKKLQKVYHAVQLRGNSDGFTV